MPHQGDATLPSSATAARRRSIAVWIWSSLVIADVVLLTRRFSGEFTGGSALLAILSTAIVATASWTAWVFFAVSFSPPLLPTSNTSTSRVIPKGIAVLIAVIWGAFISAGVSPFVLAILAVILVSQAVVVVLSEQDAPQRRLTRQSAVSGLRLQTPPEPAEHCATPLQIDGNHPEWESDGHDFSPAPNLTSSRDSNDIKDVPIAPLPVAMNALFANADEDSDLDLEECEDSSDENQTLWLSRRVTDGGEVIEGWVRVRFAESQRETVVHVAFCPPLTGPPELETEDLDGVGLEIRVAAVFPFGARLAVRRSGSLEARHTDRVGFVAQSQSNRRAA